MTPVAIQMGPVIPVVIAVTLFRQLSAETPVNPTRRLRLPTQVPPNPALPLAVVPSLNLTAAVVVVAVAANGRIAAVQGAAAVNFGNKVSASAAGMAVAEVAGNRAVEVAGSRAVVVGKGGGSSILRNQLHLATLRSLEIYQILRVSMTLRRSITWRKSFRPAAASRFGSTNSTLSLCSI